MRMKSPIIKAMRLLKNILLYASVLMLCSCAATQVALEHKSLEEETKMSETIFLDPVPNSQKTVHVSIHNTSDKRLAITRAIKSSLQENGYKVVSNPNRAHYLLQANVLKVGKMSRSASQSVIGGGYGSALAGAGAGVAVGSLSNNSNNSNMALAGGLAGGALSFAASALIKDVNFVMITDVQVSERARGNIKQQSHTQLTNGTSTKTTQNYSENSHFKRYRTRIVSNADGSVIFGVLFGGFLCYPHGIESWHESCGYGEILSSRV